ncbi:MAG TPA: 6,7-dimethyl-8-ribityllumazine synthase [Rhodospirillales bacterium]|jgi:6,7-dimethyl-8-ribityllumazine synthase|nr:6,7-dimethyl-8-ribityllumazine synthase [Rhodospirillales bacterium]
MISKGARVLIVEARYYQDLADQLAAGAMAVLDEHEIATVRIAVPGAFEIPAVIHMAMRGGGGAAYDGFIALGCVLRGETDHYDHICREVSRALMDLATLNCVPLGFGVLTCATYEQARVRAAVDGKNKGAEAARACLRMMELKAAMPSVLT